MSRSELFLLRMGTKAELERAFAQITDSAWVGSCVIEPEHLRLRFTAPPASAARLLERVYLEGGLVWSSRHALAEGSAEDEPPSSSRTS